MIIVCYVSLLHTLKTVISRPKYVVLTAYFSLFPLLSRKRTIFNGCNFRISKCVNVGNLMLMLPFGFNTVKLGYRMFFYNTIHRIKTIKLATTDLGKVRKV